MTSLTESPRNNYQNGDDVFSPHNGCDGCSPCMLNGVLCHEHGCPDAWRDYAVDCFECGCEFYPAECRASVCDDCAAAVLEGVGS